MEGSLMDQPSELMEVFDVLNAAIDAQRVRQIEEQKSNMEKERLKRELKHGHH